MDQSLFESICKRIDSYAGEAIELQRRITAVPALAPENGGDGEAAKAEVVENYLRKELRCDDIHNFAAPDDRVASGERPNLVAKIKGKSSSRTIWIMSHLDVVPPGELEKWQSDPWTVRVEDGRVYGRGTEDNQQGVVSSLLLAKALREAGVQPEYDLGLMFVADEETGSKYGIQFLLREHGSLFKPDDYYIIPDAGNPEGTLVEVAEKSILWLEFTVRGKQTHASTPDLGVNACRAAADLILALDSLHQTFPASDPVFDPPASTFEPTRREANVPNINTIPGEDVFCLDCRVLPNYTVDEVLDGVAQITREVAERRKVDIQQRVVQRVDAPPPTPVDAPVVKAVQAGILAVKGVETTPMGIGGGTVAAFFRAAGLPAVVWATQDETLHEPNEYVRIENMLSDAKVFAHVTLSG